MQTEQDPGPEEWSAACRAFRQLRDSCGDSATMLRSLIRSDGGAPTAQQRAQLFREAQGARYPSAVITIAFENPLKCGIATALAWTNPRFRAFGPACWREAFQHVGLDGKLARVWNEFIEPQAQLPPNQTFQLLNREQHARPSVPAAVSMFVEAHERREAGRPSS